VFTAEFEAEVENGKIAIPNEYRSAFEKQGSIKVILVRHGEPTPLGDGEDFIQHLLEHPLAVADLVPAHRDDFYDR
jgi:hypothetical protein